MKKILKELDAIICCIILVIMTTLAFLNVVSRYVIHASLSFTDEITTSFFVLFSLLGAAIAAKRGAHLGLNILTELFPPKVKTAVATLTNLLSGIFFLILAYLGLGMVQHEYAIGQLSSALKVPEWIYGSFIPIGCLVIAIRFLQNVYNALRKSKKEEL